MYVDPQQMIDMNAAALEKYRQKTATEGPLMLIGIGGVVLVAAIMFARARIRGRRTKRGKRRK